MSVCLLGAHTSAEGGVHNALYAGKEIKASTIQLFTSNQKRWKGKKFEKGDLEKWEKALEETGLQQVMSHASYLINLGSPKEELIEKSKQAFREEWQRCIDLKLAFLNFHPGTATTSSPEECLNQIIQSLLSFQDLTEHSPTRLLIESTAGQGTTMGYLFEHLGAIIEGVKHKLPIGVCIDTCHTFAAGYDIRTPEGWDATLKEFDTKVGLEHLYSFHLNDSKNPLNSRKDRHENLGDGEIGIESFKFLMTDPRTAHLPKYLETPGRMEIWEKEIALLHSFSKQIIK
jgi:deoxyribonuclease IV